MKVDSILLFVYAVISIKMVKAGYFDIITRNIMKYVVTSQPYAQVRLYTPRPTLVPENPFFSTSYRPVYHHTTNPISEEDFVTKDPLLQITVAGTEEQIAKQIIDKTVNDDNLKSVNPTIKLDTRTTEDNIKSLSIDDSEEFSTDVAEIDEFELQNRNEVFDLSDQNKVSSDLDSLIIKDMPFKDSYPFNQWSTKIIANTASNADNEQSDNNEFIFVKNQERKYLNDLIHRNTFPELGNVKASMDVGSEDETQPRLKRNNNVIEEESIASTISGFKYTGYNPRISEHLIFKNIHT